jgi:hypothetical protein
MLVMMLMTPPLVTRIGAMPSTATAAAAAAATTTTLETVPQEWISVPH